MHRSKPIVNDIQIIVNFLSAVKGVVIRVIILGGIQLALAGIDNPTIRQIAAKNRRQYSFYIYLLSRSCSKFNTRRVL